MCVFTDPAPVLEASHTLEERLQQLQTLAPDSGALVREISGHWKKNLERLEKTGQTNACAVRIHLLCPYLFFQEIKIRSVTSCKNQLPPKGSQIFLKETNNENVDGKTFYLWK